MGYKEMLQELCSNLEKELNDIKETNNLTKVELFSGLKPSNYFLPDIAITTISSDERIKTNAWFVELSVDDLVVFRESLVPLENEDLKIIEEMLINKVVRNIFTFGVMNSKKFIEDIKKQRASH